MNKVYSVVGCSYDEQHTFGIFSKKEQAELYANYLRGQIGYIASIFDTYYVEEHGIDNEEKIEAALENKYAYAFEFNVKTDEHADVFLEIYEMCRVSMFDHVMAGNYYDQERNNAFCSVVASSDEEATQSAIKLMTDYIATQLSS